MKNEKVDYTGVYIVKIDKLEKKVERLNNIINEFEQWIKGSKKELFMEKGTINKIFFADELLNKIKELKGSDKE